MIRKSYENTHGDAFVEGGGFPYYRPERTLTGKSDADRGKPLVINLDELNQEGKSPMNFSRKAGRVLPSLATDTDSDVQDEEDYDIE